VWGAKRTAGFLPEDWRERLAQLRLELSEYDRKGDYRYASEPKGIEQRIVGRGHSPLRRRRCQLRLQPPPASAMFVRKRHGRRTTGFVPVEAFGGRHWRRR
jgi:hypothetical protein